MKNAWLLIGIALLMVLWLAPEFVPRFVPWSGINCEIQEINIKTGHARYSRSWWYVTVSERIEETALSLALRGDTVEVVDMEAWHTVNRFSPGVGHSPHYGYHGALHQAEQMKAIVAFNQFTPDREKQIAKHILTAWQESGGDDGANDLITELMASGLSKREDMLDNS